MRKIGNGLLIGTALSTMGSGIENTVETVTGKVQRSPGEAVEECVADFFKLGTFGYPLGLVLSCADPRSRKKEQESG